MATSQRAIVLMTVGPVIQPYFLIFWAIGVALMFVLLFFANFSKTCPENIKKYLAYFSTTYILMVYIILLGISIFGGIIVWPIVLNYLVVIAWAIYLIYFRDAMGKL